jgi:hypothetical protein
MISIDVVLLVAAFIFFVLGAIPVGSKINLTAAGLACWVGSLLVRLIA